MRSVFWGVTLEDTDNPENSLSRSLNISVNISLVIKKVALR